MFVRKFLDANCLEQAVAIVFGRVVVTLEHWKPVFADGYNGSSVHWYLDPSIFVFQRNRQREIRTSNRTVLHSMTEQMPVFVRTVPSQAKRKKNVKEVFVAAPYLNYSLEFARKYGENGTPATFTLITFLQLQESDCMI